MFAASKTKGVSAVAANYIEDVFSTWLYTGTGAAQSITNGIDLAGKGGLVWTKSRQTPTWHQLQDTVRGATSTLNSNDSQAATTQTQQIQAFNSNGYTQGSSTAVNNSGVNYVSWTFREQPKFFDVVTYTGNGTNNRAIAHALGSAPGCILVKSTSNSGTDWLVYHRSLPTPTNQALYLNSTSAVVTSPYFPTAPDANNFYLAGSGYDVNTTGQTYVAYVFAHNAGGFGLTGTDNVISCGSYTVDGSGNATVNLGYETQFVIDKKSSTTSHWCMMDVMRGMSVTSDLPLIANSSAAEGPAYFDGLLSPTATGFQVSGSTAGDTHIYIAIRRGPMKVPTDATKVYEGVTRTTTNPNLFSTALTYVDMAINRRRTVSPSTPLLTSRLTGTGGLVTSSTAAEITTSASYAYNYQVNPDYYDGIGSSEIDWLFQRAPGFFDEVCYTGTGVAGDTFAHNLGVVPELIIARRRLTVASWPVYAAPLGATKYLYLNDTIEARVSNGFWNDTAPTASVFTLGGNTTVNGAGNASVAYLFASCPGVSKVGSYTGNGTTQTINCGFAGGARFVLIKRTDSTGDWYVYDTARGMTVLVDPYLLLNSTAAESATLGSVITTSVGFIVDATILAAVNTNGASYIYLAIA